MLLFCDGFESFDGPDLWRKWYVAGESALVFGMDTSRFPAQPWARGNDPASGRALLFTDDVVIGTIIRKSRVLYVGIAVRQMSAVDTRFTLQLGTLIDYRANQSIGGLTFDNHPSRTTWVASCDVVLPEDGTTVGYTWRFPEAATQSGSINMNTPPSNGHYYYYQFGISLAGNENDPPTSWVETRIGNRLNKVLPFHNIYTAPPGSYRSYYINSVAFYFKDPVCVDDVYVCNDEGDVNNDFLGSVRIRRMRPVIEGAISDANKIGFSGSAHLGVDVDLVNTFDEPPVTPPDPEADPMYIAYEDPRSKKIVLEKEGDTQVFRCTDPNYFGATPRIYAVVGTAIVRTQDTAETYYGYPFSQLVPVIRLGGQGVPLQEGIHSAMPLYRPYLVRDGGLYGGGAYGLAEWDRTQLVFENPRPPGDGEGYVDPLWNPTVLADAEYGFRLVRYSGDQKDWIPVSLRHTLVINTTIEEDLGFTEFMHRGFEYVQAETLEVVGANLFEYSFRVVDELTLTEECSAVRTGTKVATSRLTIQSVFNEIYRELRDEIGLEAFTKNGFGHDILDWLAVPDWVDGWWTEQVTDNLENQETVIPVEAIFIGEQLDIDVSYLWSGHELADEALDIIVSYIFSGHEMLSEYLHTEVFTKNGYGHAVDDGILLTGDHFDGWWVEESTFGIEFDADVYIMHYEFDPLLLWIEIKDPHLLFDDNPNWPYPIVDEPRWW